MLAKINYRASKIRLKLKNFSGEEKSNNATKTEHKRISNV